MSLPSFCVVMVARQVIIQNYKE